MSKHPSRRLSAILASESGSHRTGSAVSENYGNSAAGPSSAAQFKRGGSVMKKAPMFGDDISTSGAEPPMGADDGADPTMKRYDRRPRRASGGRIDDVGRVIGGQIPNVLGDADDMDMPPNVGMPLQGTTRDAERVLESTMANRPMYGDTMERRLRARGIEPMVERPVVVAPAPLAGGDIDTSFSDLAARNKYEDSMSSPAGVDRTRRAFHEDYMMPRIRGNDPTIRRASGGEVDDGASSMSDSSIGGGRGIMQGRGNNPSGQRGNTTVNIVVGAPQQAPTPPAAGGGMPPVPMLPPARPPMAPPMAGPPVPGMPPIPGGAPMPGGPPLPMRNTGGRVGSGSGVARRDKQNNGGCL